MHKDGIYTYSSRKVGKSWHGLTITRDLEAIEGNCSRSQKVVGGRKHSSLENNGSIYLEEEPFRKIRTRRGMKSVRYRTSVTTIKKKVGVVGDGDGEEQSRSVSTVLYFACFRVQEVFLAKLSS